MQTELENLRKENLFLQSLLQKKDLRIAKLEEEIRLQLLARFGKKSERYDNPNQLTLFNEVETDAASAKEEVEAITVAGYKKQRAHRQALPSFLPRETVVHDLTDEDKICPHHGEVLIQFGEDTSEQLSIVPEQIKVIKHVRPKYKCPCCDGLIKQVKMPPQPIPQSVASPSLLAYICVSKYVDHLPLYRLEKKFERICVSLSRLTMARWMIKLSDLLTPLYNCLEEELLDGGFLQMDETSVQVLKEPGRPASSKSYMWVRARDGTRGPPIILYDYNKSRSAIVVVELLSSFKGVLQTDGYSAYDTYASRCDVLHAGCLAHCRRKFFEAFKSSKREKGTYADQAMSWFKEVYRIEAETKSMTLEQKLAHRRQFMSPLFEKFKVWLDAAALQLPATLKTGEAVSYMLSQWDKLTHVLTRADIPLDTNFIEGRIRPFTIGRKNWMFSDSVAGAKASAMLYSIIETAKANNVEPYHYLAKVIEALPKCQSGDEVAAFLPYNLS